MELRSEEFSYSDRDDLANNRIYSRTTINIPLTLCNEPGNEIGIIFKVDTGASSVILPASMLGLGLSEEEYKNIYKTVPKPHVGIARNVKIYYYTHIVREMHIGKIILKNVPIEITFDPNATSILLGMTVIGLFNTQINSEFKTITFTETQELAQYTHFGRPVTDILSICKDEYIDFTAEDIEAHYINNLAKHTTD